MVVASQLACDLTLPSEAGATTQSGSWPLHCFVQAPFINIWQHLKIQLYGSRDIRLLCVAMLRLPAVHLCRSLLDSGTVQPTLEFFCSQLILNHTQHSDSFYLLCMVFIHHVVKCPSYRGGSMAVEAHMGPDRVRTVMHPD